MMGSTRPLAQTAPPRWLGPALVAGSSALIAVPGVLGLSSLPSIALLGAATLGALAWLLYALPGALVVLVPACLPSPMIAYTYVWEILLVLLIGVVALHGQARRAAWLQRLSWLELALLAFTAWGLFSGFWSDDARTYVTQVRRLLLGMGTLWIASRLPHVAPRRWFEAGVILATISLSLAALGRFVTSGFSIEEATQHRPEVTQLGWGTANFIATLLLLLAPVVIALAGHSKGRTRIAAWVALALAALMQVLISSRAAEVLFVLGTIAQLMVVRGRRGFGPALVTVTLLGGLLASPLGQAVFVRFTSLRELGSMTVRIWYFREAGRRLVEHLPFGLGLGQGYAYPDKLQGLDPHNYWLTVGGDLGIPGLLLWLAVLVQVVLATLRLVRTPAWRPMGIALIVAFATSQVHTLVEPTFQGTQYQFVYFWLVGGLIAYHSAGAARAPAAAASSSR